jgi:ATP-binding cassette subfamily B protein RaxB
MIFTIASTFLFGLDRVLIVFFGARVVLDGALSVGMLVAFLAYKDQFSQRVGKCLDTIVKLGTLTVHGERIADIALAEPEPGDAGQLNTSAGTVISRKAGLRARPEIIESTSDRVNIEFTTAFSYHIWWS